MTTLAQVARIQDPARREHFVYRAYDAQGLLLYIGCTMQPELRLKGHQASNAEWLRHVARYRAHGPYNYSTARRMERDAIRELQPPFNSDTVKYKAAKKVAEQQFARQTAAYLAAGMSFNDAAVRAVGDLPAGAPRTYRPLRSA